MGFVLVSLLVLYPLVRAIHASATVAESKTIASKNKKGVSCTVKTRKNETQAMAECSNVCQLCPM